MVICGPVMKLVKTRKTAVIRARATEALAEEVQLAAQQLGVDPSDVIRLAVKEKVRQILQGVGQYAQAA